MPIRILNSSIARLQAIRAVRSRDWDAAARAYATAARYRPKVGNLWVQYGNALKESGREDEAEIAYRRAIEAEPDRVDAHLQLGHLLKRLGRIHEAADAYAAAARLDPMHGPAATAFGRLPGGAIDSTTDTRGVSGFSTDRGGGDLFAHAPQMRGGPEASTGIVFDVADLMTYFGEARLPTGIQRVQIEVVRAALLSSPASTPVAVCAYSGRRDAWIGIPSAAFIKLCDLSLASGDTDDPAWRAAVRDLNRHMLSAPAHGFSDGECLINLGTSWWTKNYFLSLRNIKRRFRIAYVPFVHDLIPALMPEHCDNELATDFFYWLQGVFYHADAFLANSESTKRDLISVAETLGHSIDPGHVEVVRLDGDSRPTDGSQSDRRVLRKFGLRADGFVLFVSTIESRKNHVGAFGAWRDLIARRSANRVPRLVCVGNRGWLNDAVHATLAADRTLRSRVTLLSRLSDAELATLYRSCLFSLYPSHYEGWGLPITESLCHGKPVLASSAPAHLEAGDAFADYFPVGSNAGLAAAAEKLIFDAGYRQSREALVRGAFRPRAWADISSQVMGSVDRLGVRSAGSAPGRNLKALKFMPAEPDRYYPLSLPISTRVSPELFLGEMFRMGDGWFWPDRECARVGPGGGELGFRLHGPHPAMTWRVDLCGPLEGRCDWRFQSRGDVLETSARGTLARDALACFEIHLPASSSDSVTAGVLSCAPVSGAANGKAEVVRPVESVGVVGFIVFPDADDPHEPPPIATGIGSPTRPLD